MTMFQFAIASIVDANTGNGLIHDHGKLDYAADERHGREIRANSISALLSAIGSRFGEFVQRQRTAARQRRELRILEGLNDHLLDDIGISRADLHSVRLGAVTLGELYAGYRATRAVSHPEQRDFSAGNRVALDLDASNEQFFATRKCA